MARKRTGRCVLQGTRTGAATVFRTAHPGPCASIDVRPPNCTLCHPKQRVRRSGKDQTTRALYKHADQTFPPFLPRSPSCIPNPKLHVRCDAPLLRVGVPTSPLSVPALLAIRRVAPARTFALRPDTFGELAGLTVPQYLTPQNPTPVLRIWLSSACVSTSVEMWPWNLLCDRRLRYVRCASWCSGCSAWSSIRVHRADWPKGYVSNFDNPEFLGVPVVASAGLCIPLVCIFVAVRIYARVLVRKWTLQDCKRLAVVLISLILIGYRSFRLQLRKHLKDPLALP